jgi:hypothetical protein
MAAVIEVKYFNAFLLKKIFGSPADTPIWGGSFGIPTIIGGWPAANIVQSPAKEWVVEEARIQGGYENSSVDFGVKAYIVEEDNSASTRSSSLIYSGVFNSRTGINNTNQFSVGEDITKSLDPSNGSIQKIYAEDTNLIIFQENKVSRALIDKDAIYSAEGGGSVTSSNVVIGQIQAYAGNYGISKDPESFAVYGYRKYFTDRYRNAVLRLSQDGITEISEYGMTDFFRDEFANIDSPSSSGVGSIVAGWDVHNKQYILSLQRSTANANQNYSTLSYSEQSNGFVSFLSFKPSQIISLKNKVYSFKNGVLWLHYNETANTRCNFYGTQYGSSIRFVFNTNPSDVKIFKTINYEGANGWQVDSFKSDFTGPDQLGLNYSNSQDTTGVLSTFKLLPTDVVTYVAPSVFSYELGAYDGYNNVYPQTLYPPIYRAGFDRKENKYMANLINKSLANQEEISYGDAVSGIKGYFIIVDMSLDTVTQVGGVKELFSVSTNYDYSTN